MLCVAGVAKGSGGFLVATGHQDAGVQAVGACRWRALAVVGEQAPDQVVVHAEAAQQRVARGDLHHLRRRQQADQRGAFLADAEAEQRLVAVGCGSGSAPASGTTGWLRGFRSRIWSAFMVGILVSCVLGVSVAALFGFSCNVDGL